MTAHLADLTSRRSVLLTTYKRDGAAVGTPVARRGRDGRAFIRTYGKAWKWRRVRNHPDSEIAPSTVRGAPTGPPVPVRGRILDGEEAARAAVRWRASTPSCTACCIPRVHRLMRTADHPHGVHARGAQSDWRIPSARSGSRRMIWNAARAWSTSSSVASAALDAVAPDPAHRRALVALGLAVAQQHADLQRVAQPDRRQLGRRGADDREVARREGPLEAAVGGSGV